MNSNRQVALPSVGLFISLSVAMVAFQGIHANAQTPIHSGTAAPPTVFLHRTVGGPFVRRLVSGGAATGTYAESFQWADSAQYKGIGITQNATATIFSNGYLSLVTNTVEITHLRGGSGSVTIIGLDDRLNPIWTKTATHGADGKGIFGIHFGQSNRYDNDSWTLSPAEMALTTKVTLSLNPAGNILADVEGFLTHLANDTALAAKVVKSIQGLTGPAGATSTSGTPTTALHRSYNLR